MLRGSLSPFCCGFSILFAVARWLRDGCKEAAFCETVLLVEAKVGSVRSGENLRGGRKEAAGRLRGSNCICEMVLLAEAKVGYVISGGHFCVFCLLGKR